MEKLTKIVGMVKERANFVSDIWEQSSFFFQAPEEYDAKAVKKRWKESTPELLEAFKAELEALEPFTAGSIHDMVGVFISKREIGFGQVMIPLRICLVGSTFGPDLTTICEILGKEEVISRINKALARI
jgi:glutamyl-tRNA synthetase